MCRYISAIFCSTYLIKLPYHQGHEYILQQRIRQAAVLKMYFQAPHIVVERLYLRRHPFGPSFLDHTTKNT